MKKRALFAAIILTLSVSASADFKTISRAYEVPLSIFNVPVTHTGTISFGECRDCQFVSARLTVNTQFVVNGISVELKDFRAQAFQVRDRASTAVTVLHHLETNTITSISMRR